HIGDDDGAFFAQDFIGSGGGGAVGGLDDQRRLDAFGVAKVDDPFQSGRDENVAFVFKHLGPVFNKGGIGVAFDAVIGGDPLAHRFDIKPVFADQRAVMFDNAGDDAVVVLAQEFGGVVADIAETLHDHALAIQCARKTGGFHVFGVAEEFAQGK